MNKVINLLLIFSVALAFSSCKKNKTGGSGEYNSATGWEHGNPEYGGFEKLDYEGQINGPNLVLIEGGTFTMGTSQQDVTFEWNNVPRRVTVSSFLHG